MDALFGPEPKLVALHGAPGPVVERCAFQAKLGELVGDTVRLCERWKRHVVSELGATGHLRQVHGSAAA
jgi:hypothetical protein